LSVQTKKLCNLGKSRIIFLLPGKLASALQWFQLRRLNCSYKQKLIYDCFQNCWLGFIAALFIS
jgi:hypothetical protein